MLILLPNHPDYTIVEVNEAYLKATNSEVDDLIGRSLFEAFPANPDEPDGRNGVKNLLASLSQVIASRQAHKIELQKYDIPVRGSNKFEQKYWAPHNLPVLNENEEIDFIIHAPVDVTRRVLAEQKGEVAREELGKEILLRESIQKQLLIEKNFAESMINSLPGVFYLIDKQGKFCRWNNNLEILTGYTREEIETMHLAMCISEEYRGNVRNAIDETFTKGKAEVEACLLSKDGRETPYFFNGISIKLDGESFLIGTGSDITELIRERSERMRLSKILEKSRNEIYIFDAETLHFIYVNAGARENLGFTLNELYKITPLDLMPEFKAEEFQQLVRPLRNQTRDKIVFKTVHRRADESLYHVEVHLQLIEQDDRRVFVAIILDITERLKIEARIKSSLQEKEVLLNEIHHRVKNNLAIISSLLNMQAGSTNDDRLNRLLSESGGRVRTMGMIHEMLYQQEDFSRIDFGIYIRKLLQFISGNYSAQEIAVTTEVETNDVFLAINTAVPCALIINELITNAFKHAFTGRTSGKISISFFRLADMYTLKISDNGKGLPKNLKHTSMGMTLIEGLVRQLDGTIKSKSKNGTAFTITFPAARNLKPESKYSAAGSRLVSETI